jgi:hypothetical protein
MRTRTRNVVALTCIMLSVWLWVRQGEEGGQKDVTQSCWPSAHSVQLLLSPGSRPASAVVTDGQEQQQQQQPSQGEERVLDDVVFKLQDPEDPAEVCLLCLLSCMLDHSLC